MPFDAPLKVGPFTVDAEGRLSPGDLNVAPAFLFRWHNRVVRARLAQAEAGNGKLLLQATIARVPSTASTADDTMRPRIFALLRWMEKSVPDDWQVRLVADHRVCLEIERPISLPITAVALITEVTCFLLALAPHLDLLDESGLTVPVAPVT